MTEKTKLPSVLTDRLGRGPEHHFNRHAYASTADARHPQHVHERPKTAASRRHTHVGEGKVATAAFIAHVID
jgi:hypothetical protein